VLEQYWFPSMNYSIDGKINLITTRMSNHARHSGYDRLVEFIEAKNVFSETELSLFSRVLARGLSSFVNNSNLEWYNRHSFIEEINAGRNWLISRGQIFHYLYGENSYRYLGNLKSVNKSNAIVCTYHTPPDRFCQVVRLHEHLKQLDAIVAVSRVQIDYLSQFTGCERTFFVPHGIDVDYFKPGVAAQKNEGPIKCLFVGTHLRDVETLVEVSHLLNGWGEQCEIVAVTGARNKEIIQKSNNIRLRMGVTDEELLQLYQQSDILLLPLLDATANNSVLEAMACGLPIVSTDLEGVKDYVNEECALLFKKKDAKGLAEGVIQLARDQDLRESMSAACRTQAMKFSWESIADQMREIYKLVQS